MDRARRLGWAVLTAVWIAVMASPTLLAQAQEDFKPITAEEAALERLPATPFVFAAYAIVWLVLIAYVFGLWRRIGRVEQELSTLTARLNEPRR